MKKETIFINLFGGPGSGKSTLCGSVFAKLKKSGVDCELALEYVKDLVWEESFKKIENQVYIFAKQQHTLFRLNGKVDVVITDSPLINSIIYYKGDNEHFEKFVLAEFNRLNSVNYYIKRAFAYVENGRMQNLEEAIKVDIKYKDFLNENDIPYSVLNADNEDIIVNDILQKLKSR